MARPAAVICRHRDRLRRSGAHGRSPADPRRPDAGRRRGGVGSHDACSSRSRRSTASAPRRRCSTSSWFRCRCSRSGPLVFGEHIDAVPSAIALGVVRLSNPLGGECHIPDLVRAYRALFGRPIVGVHLPCAALRRCGRPSRPWRAADTRFCHGRHSGGLRAGPRKPPAVRLYFGCSLPTQGGKRQKDLFR